MYTKLDDKTLWFDGDLTLTEDQLCDRMLSGMPVDNCFVEELSRNIKRYNLISETPLDVKYNNRDIDPTWDIPEEYLNIDIREYCINKVREMINSEAYNDAAMSRIEYECQLIKNLNMSDLFRSIIFLIDYFKQNNIVWGVGRGSSCASYVLYLFGLHCVDCLVFNIDAKEFFRTT